MADKKKDLTSLIELSNLEMENAPPEPINPALPESTGLESDFASLDTLSQEASQTEAPPTLTEQALTMTEPSVTAAEPTDTNAPLAEPSFTSAEPSTTGPSLDIAPEPSMPDMVLSEPDAMEPTFTTKSAPMMKEPTIMTGMVTPTKTLEDLSGVKAFGDKLTIGKPRVEASPAFSLLATGKFNKKTIKIIEDTIGSDDYGVSVGDISVQLKSGKLLVPQISEFAAITLAQKIRDVVDNIEIGPAEEIFKGSAEELAPEQPMFVENQMMTEAHDLEIEPQSEKDLFSSNLSELQGFKVTRALSTLTVSEVLSRDIAENPSSKKFETVTQQLTQELIKRAFKLRANGVIGVSFSLNPIDQYDPESKSTKRAYRILATGTAVQGKREP